LEGQSYLTIEEAKEYLNVDSIQLRVLISESKLRVGLYAKNWIGVAIPNIEKIYGKLAIHPYKISPSGERTFLLEYTNKNEVAKRTSLVQECEVCKFWFLDNDSANSIIYSTKPMKTDIVYLKPFDGKTLKKNEPEKFPFDDFMVELSKTYIELEIQQEELYFIKSDLDAYSDEPLKDKNKTSLSNSKPTFPFIIPSYRPIYTAKAMQETFQAFVNENQYSPTKDELWTALTKAELRNYDMLYVEEDNHFKITKDVTKDRRFFTRAVFDIAYKRYKENGQTIK
jgi:hypothetical protein